MENNDSKQGNAEAQKDITRDAEFSASLGFQRLGVAGKNICWQLI